MLAIFLVTYATVFAAEIVGDKLLYTTGILTTRYPTRAIVCGITLAFMAKMGAAVLIGQAISELPRGLVATVTAMSFGGIAYAMWRKPTAGRQGRDRRRPANGAVVSFASVFFSEWADVGQIAAATMAARYGAPLTVWTGAVLAMVTKGTLAAAIGAGVRRTIQQRLSPRTVRLGGVALLLVLAALSVAETLTSRP